MIETTGRNPVESACQPRRPDRRARRRGSTAWRAAVVLWSALVASSGCSGDAGCNERCEGDGDCASSYVCLAIGTETNQVCMPEECEDCMPRACVVSAPVDGECSYRDCM